jgi:hypothetical protein
MNRHELNEAAKPLTELKGIDPTAASAGYGAVLNKAFYCAVCRKFHNPLETFWDINSIRVCEDCFITQAKNLSPAHRKMLAELED